MNLRLLVVLGLQVPQVEYVDHHIDIPVQKHVLLARTENRMLMNGFLQTFGFVTSRVFGCHERLISWPKR